MLKILYCRDKRSIGLQDTIGIGTHLKHEPDQAYLFGLNAIEKETSPRREMPSRSDRKRNQDHGSPKDLSPERKATWRRKGSSHGAFSTLSDLRRYSSVIQPVSPERAVPSKKVAETPGTVSSRTFSIFKPSESEDRRLKW